MSSDYIPDDAEVLFNITLDPNSFTLIGTVPNRYPTGITLYITNEDKISTVMSQVIISRHQTANAANVYNKTMYIPAGQMAILTKLVNIAGLNVFVKTSGTLCSAILVHTNTLDNGRSIYNATPTVINQDQTIVTMPAPVMGNSNSVDTRIMNLAAQLAEAFAFINSLNNTVPNNYTALQNKIGSLELLIQDLSNSITGTSTTSITSGNAIQTDQTTFDGLTSGLITENYVNLSIYNKINFIFTDYSNGNINPFTLPLLYKFSQNPSVLSNIYGLNISVTTDTITFYPSNPETLYTGQVTVEL